MTDKLPAVVQASIDATNAGDLKAFLATFDADGAVDDWGRVFVGNSAITRWSDNDLTFITESDISGRDRADLG